MTTRIQVLRSLALALLPPALAPVAAAAPIREVDVADSRPPMTLARPTSLPVLDSSI